MEDVRSDFSIPIASIVILQETWAMEKDPVGYYDLYRFKLVHRSFSKPHSKTRPHRSIYAYLKPDVLSLHVQEIHHGLHEVHYLQLRKENQNFQILSLYKHPRGNVNCIIENINSVPITTGSLVILGDMNVDHFKQSSKLDRLQNICMIIFMSVQSSKEKPHIVIPALITYTPEENM